MVLVHRRWDPGLESLKIFPDNSSETGLYKQHWQTPKLDNFVIFKKLEMENKILYYSISKARK